MRGAAVAAGRGGAARGGAGASGARRDGAGRRGASTGGGGGEARLAARHEDRWHRGEEAGEERRVGGEGGGEAVVTAHVGKVEGHKIIRSRQARRRAVSRPAQRRRVHPVHDAGACGLERLATRLDPRVLGR